MRLTVGPLPPAVYWRRRLIVLGVLLVVVFFGIYACGGDSGRAGDRQAGPTSSASPTGEPSGTATGSVPAIVLSEPPPPAPTTTAPAVPPSGPCIDAEVSVTPVPHNNKTQLARGESITIYLRIRNISGRTCSRDIGGDQQELRIAQGAQTLWSSDHCDGVKGSFVQSLRPGQQVEGTVLWNGRGSTNCQARPLPNPGTYQLFGRLGTKTSDPVTLTIT
jgi:hypothetical protein